MLIELLKSVLNLFCASGQQQQAPPTISSSPQGGHPAHGNQNNDSYVSLRVQANEHGDQMAKCFRQSHEAYTRGDGALAKQLSNEGKEHQKKMEEFNKKASDSIFAENNKDSNPGQVDLHGLFVKEAISRADLAIQTAKYKGFSQIRFIVGKGNHSHGGIAKIKPAIEELMAKYSLNAQLDHNNSGVVIVFFDSPIKNGIGAEEISRQLAREDERCIIM